jgi:hypothetical protein
MELTKYAKAIKNELSMELAKNGSSLEEFEQALAHINTGEGVYKVASDAGGILNNYMGKSLDMAGGIPEFALKGSLAGGALAGLTLDEADKSVDMLNKSLEREREKVNLVRRITHNLKREHGLI